MKKRLRASRFGAIDPGVNGAAVMIRWPRHGAPRIEEAIDAPTTTKKIGRTNRKVYSLNEIGDIGVRWGEENLKLVIIEDVTPNPKFGANNFTFGQGKTAWEMAMIMGGVPYMLVRPQSWKKEVGLPSKADKEASRLLAMKLFPKDADLFKLKKDDGKAEAALMAYRAGILHGGT